MTRGMGPALASLGRHTASPKGEASGLLLSPLPHNGHVRLLLLLAGIRGTTFREDVRELIMAVKDDSPSSSFWLARVHLITFRIEAKTLGS